MGVRRLEFSDGVLCLVCAAQCVFAFRLLLFLALRDIEFQSKVPKNS